LRLLAASKLLSEDGCVEFDHGFPRRVFRVLEINSKTPVSGPIGTKRIYADKLAIDIMCIGYKALRV
jgi:hypothetical protein